MPEESETPILYNVLRSAFTRLIDHSLCFNEIFRGPVTVNRLFGSSEKITLKIVFLFITYAFYVYV